MKSEDKKFLKLLKKALEFIVENTDGKKELTELEFQAISLNLKTVFQMLKTDSLDESCFSSEFINSYPTLYWKEAREIRNGLVHGYFLYDALDVLELCQKCIPYLNKQIDVIVGEGKETSNISSNVSLKAEQPLSLSALPPIDEFSLVKKIKAYQTEKEKRSSQDRGRDMYRCGMQLLDVVERINEMSKKSTSPSVEMKKFKYAAQNCVEIYGEASNHLFIGKTSHAKDKIAEELQALTNNTGETSIVGARNIRNESAHTVELLPLASFSKFATSFEKIKYDFQLKILRFELDAGTISREEYQSRMTEILNKKTPNLFASLASTTTIMESKPTVETSVVSSMVQTKPSDTKKSTESEGVLKKIKLELPDSTRGNQPKEPSEKGSLSASTPLTTSPSKDTVPSKLTTPVAMPSKFTGFKLLMHAPAPTRYIAAFAKQKGESEEPEQTSKPEKSNKSQEPKEGK